MIPHKKYSEQVREELKNKSNLKRAKKKLAEVLRKELKKGGKR